MRNFSEAEVEALERLNLNDSPHASSPLSRSQVLSPTAAPTTNGAQVKAKKVDIAGLEAKAESGAINGDHRS